SVRRTLPPCGTWTISRRWRTRRSRPPRTASDAPRARGRAAGARAAEPVTLSVVVPVLDEARRIAGHLSALHRVAGIDEVVVVDGGSRDDTVAIAQRAPGVGVITSGRGRGIQMTAGARAARGDVLLFLHADAVLPPDSARLIARALEDPAVVAGAFRVHTVAEAGGPRRR